MALTTHPPSSAEIKAIPLLHPCTFMAIYRLSFTSFTFAVILLEVSVHTVILLEVPLHTAILLEVPLPTVILLEVPLLAVFWKFHSVY